MNDYLPLKHDKYKLRRIHDFQCLFARYKGRKHARIETEMRLLGHVDFHRRTLYSRFERGHHHPGWIELYGSAPVDVALQTDFESRLNAAVPLADARASVRDTSETASRRTTSKDFDDFQQWLMVVSPHYQWSFRHQIYIFKKLKRVTDGLTKRLMVFMPPRHGKSEMVTVGYAAWRMRNDPSTNIVLGSYNQRLANRFSRKIKRTLVDDYHLHKDQPPYRQPSVVGGQLSENAAAESICGSPPYEGGVAAASVDGVVLSAPQGPGKAGTPNSEPCSPPYEGGVAAASADAVVLSPRPQNTAFTPPAHAGGSALYASGSPFPFASKRRANSDAEWETSYGGGLRAVGVGSGVTGFGADLIIVDDPIKSRAEAESVAYRERVYEWFNDDLYTRLEPDGAIILIQTRWHEDDLAGRLLRESREEGGEQWEVIDLPALAEGSIGVAGIRSRGVEGVGSEGVEEGRNLQSSSASISDRSSPDSSTPPLPNSPTPPLLPPVDEIGRSPGEALWPERFPVETLERIRRKLGTYSYAALYQQKPVPAEGGLFKREWFRVIPSAPNGIKWKRATDPGLMSTANADYTASFRVAFDRDNNLYIDGGFRKQLEYPELRRYILGRMREERDTEQHGVELAAHGTALVQDLGRELSCRGRPLQGIKVQDNKVSRALSWIALAEQGKVFLVRGGWNRDFIDECCSFPVGTHDDQIDAVSLGVQMARRSGNGVAFIK